MSPSLSFPVAYTLLTLTLTFLFCALSSPSVLAQKFTPKPYYIVNKCSTFVEGQGFYFLTDGTQDSFMIDLSVSWNASDPVYRKLKAGPKVYGTCAATNNGDLFTILEGRGYIYNAKSNSWTSFQNLNFATTPSSKTAVLDPETGIIYLPDAGVDMSGKRVMLSIDTGAETVNSTAMNPYGDDERSTVFGWSGHLRSLFALNGTDMILFTPSKVTESSDGWSLLSTTGRGKVDFLDCGAPANGGSTMVFLGGYFTTTDWLYFVYTLDVVKRTWKQGPSVLKDFKVDGCAVSGDQLITLGYMEPYTLDSVSMTLVFNMKTAKWVSRYVAPPRQPTATTATASYTLQPSPTQTVTTSGLSGTSFNAKTLTIIIAAVAACLLACILGLFVYRQRAKKSEPNGSSTDSLNIKEDIHASRKGGPPDYAHTRLHQDAPHAIVEDPTSKRCVQEGALAIEMPPQHPHTTVNQHEHTF
ncbi:MAG: hypothetical protein J3Q66DRAFT_432235 [Benniella sp.]|nr:MAG: hypothetical protein J3Q66DRAFT_432235 [Benniella sp.]